jgi:hypothetical protein
MLMGRRQQILAVKHRKTWMKFDFAPDIFQMIQDLTESESNVVANDHPITHRSLLVDEANCKSNKLSEQIGGRSPQASASKELKNFFTSVSTVAAQSTELLELPVSEL